MPHITVHQHVHAPLAAAFEHFVDFERYPEFMKAVQSVRPDEAHADAFRFNYRVAGIERQCALTMDIDHDSYAVAWRSSAGPEHTGAATFREITAHTCNLTVNIELRSGSVVDATEAVLGIVRSRIEQDLHRFAAHVEEVTGRRPPPDAPNHRAPSEKLFDAVFPTDERRLHP